MPRLSDLINTGQRLSIIGPYGTQVAERVARDVVESPQMAAGVPNLESLGAGCSALLTEKGQAYLQQIALDYVASVPNDHPLVVVTPSFRLAKQVLEAAASVRGVDPNLPALGLEFCLDSITIAQGAITHAQRSRENTLLAMSVGPPFECYEAERTPPDIDNKYLPQVFAAIRFGHPLDYLMFETVPSLHAAIGAAVAFTRAHKVLHISDSKDRLTTSGTRKYMESLLNKVRYMGSEAFGRLVPSYDPTTSTFQAIEPQKEYVISLCLDEQGRLYCDQHNLYGPQRLELALNALRHFIASRGLYPPVGISINCNSPEVTERALEQLQRDGGSTFGGLASPDRPRNSDWIIGIHPNASSENDPRKYESMTTQQAIPVEDFASRVTGLVNRFDLKIIGGCCGTDHHTMKRLY
ncbi:homocysteine S-methyltransferase family protein [Candidatus Woesearchaeota archaeon]|nr:homocysteine S-methyltransferase family protein [Candidatus Woesearchaeota archaeon]